MNLYAKKVVSYTLVISIFLIIYKLLITHLYANKEMDITYFSIKFLVKLSLFLFTIYLLKKNNLKFRNVNKHKLITFVIISLLTYFTIQKLIFKANQYNEEIFNYKLLIYSLANLSIGFFEEFFFRILIFGLVYKALKSKNLFNVTLITSFIFAIAHLGNIFLVNYSLSDILFQTGFAFAVGILFQLILINFKNIYLISFIHALNDFKSNFDYKFLNISHDVEQIETGFDYETLIIIIIMILIMISLAYFNLRKKSSISFLQ